MSNKEIIKSFLDATKISTLCQCNLSCFSYSHDTTRLQKEVNTLLADLYGESPSRQLRLALDEIIRNAYEHGNLEFSGSEKSSLLDSESFESALKLRETKFGNRKINVFIEVIGLKVKISVSDQGAGFNWKSQNMEPSSDLLHGRGLAIIKAATDKVTYNGLGNTCIIEKQFIKQ